MMLKEQHDLQMRALAEEEAAKKKKAEEDEAARKKKEEEEKELRRKRYAVEKEYIRKKYEALKEASEAGSSVSSNSREKVSGWLASGTTGNVRQSAPPVWEFPPQLPNSHAQPVVTSALYDEAPNVPIHSSAESNSHNITIPTSSSTPHGSFAVPSTIPNGTEASFHRPVENVHPHINYDQAPGHVIRHHRPIGNNPIGNQGMYLPPAIRWSSTEISPTTVLQMINNERQNQFRNDLAVKTISRSTPRPLPPRLAALRAEANIMTAVCRGSIPSATTAGPYVPTGIEPNLNSRNIEPLSVSSANCVPIYSSRNNSTVDHAVPLAAGIQPNSTYEFHTNPTTQPLRRSDLDQDISPVVVSLGQLTTIQRHQEPLATNHVGNISTSFDGPTKENIHQPLAQQISSPIARNDFRDDLNSYRMPSAAQLAARQVISRDLPHFDGDPQDWPLFYGTFQNSTKSCGFSDEENLSRLQRCLRGPAFEAVRSRLMIPESVPLVIDILKRQFGRPDILIHALLNDLRRIAPPKEDNLQSIINFGLAVRNSVDHMITANLLEHLSNPTLLQELIAKLPIKTQMDWSRFKRQYTTVNLEVFSIFTNELVDTATDVIMPRLVPKHENAKKVGKDRQTLYTHTLTEVDTSQEIPKKCCVFCGYPNHVIATCEAFQRLDMDARLKAVKEKNLCRTCLVPHRKWPCRSTNECGIDGCRIRHHTLLHSSTLANLNSSPHVNVAHHHSDRSYSLYRYLPIVLQANGKSVEVIAFLDDGSSSTLLENSVATELGVKGERESLWLSWTSNVSREEKGSQRISVTASGLGKKNKFKLNNVRTVANLILPSQTLDYESMKKTYPHLRGLPIHSYSDATPSMIIGIEHATLLTSLKTREGCSNDPIAVKTRLGWCVFGRQMNGVQSIETLNVHCQPQQCDHELHQLIKGLLKLEEPKAEAPVSESDKRALAILEKTTRRVDGRFETGLLFKNSEPRFPNSRPMAERRLQALERRLARNPFLGLKVREQINQYLEKGYAHRASMEELQGTDPEKTWYLPLGVVQNPKKPQKIRLIWDAAARVQGVSFNDALLTGPDLLTSLPDVLTRFRQRNIAITGDIKEMFHQIRIRDSDKQYQRFLFREDQHQPPQVYVMDVATFGATCSPCIAQYVKNRNAMEHASEFPLAAEDIMKDHYMDDYLKSVDTADEAVELVNQVRLVHSKGGFEIRNFTSNSKEVLDRLGKIKDRQQKALYLETGLNTVENPERVLGMIWNPQEDVFTFDALQIEALRQMDSKEPPTKRQVLKIIMSVFDPLGLIAHFVIHGKILMQEIWKYGCDWDERIPAELQETWFQWSDKLKKLNQVNVPRCLFKNSNPASFNTLQLHTFVDASEAAYSGVVYARIIDEGVPKCAIIAAKTKVAPLKPLSIPRLELQAAVEGSRLIERITNALTLPISRRFIWSDSTTVLAWLRSDSRRYHQFVSCRVGEILRTTSINEWRYVPTKLNVADEATKWKTEPSFDPQSRWFTGPDFLRKPESEWPSKFQPTSSPEEEIRTTCVHHAHVFQPQIDYSRYSQFHRLQRAMAYFLRIISWFKGNDIALEARVLEAEEIENAENFLWRQVQMEAYPEEYNRLLHQTEDSLAEKNTINKRSLLYQMTPYMDENRVLRMNSRIGAAPATAYETKYPVFLPKEHRVTYLLVHHYHRRFLHGNHETVVNEIRQRFQIPHLRTLVKRVGKECQMCKIKKAVPKLPIMAPLPAVRLTPFIKPFTHTGIDYFGPQMVKQGRSLVKRWVALFTCLTIRAVHLEIVYSLSTQSCVMAIRRFIARRGSPATIYTDNGTNFLGANNLMIDQIKNAHEGCASVFTNAQTRWYFNPPATPHMGGPWERMVRSVKTAMDSIAAHPQHPSDEVLETVVLEAESIVNSRPLTYVPLDAAESEALTPNHFLLYGSVGIHQPQKPLMITERVLRDSWNLTQTLVDKFWVRWVKEYLPMLTRRTKWFSPTKPLKAGDLVIVVNEKKRNGWVRARVVSVITAPDGQVRRAVVRSANGESTKSVANLALLDVEASSGDLLRCNQKAPELHGWGNDKNTPGFDDVSGVSPDSSLK
ncbi:uncharacterized protein LOC129752777 [Uranotaenia lowii]|uniref:uncharacterized protein LOC129752777 n=1 Tax=Uranotaenia lowii TaxID=190385 RepID=UPI00247B1FC3|nr:uncharacterized protein LOC129752777 [Uranotaenia lowii]